jgi:small-conductance mechanosensitive channel
MDDILAVNFLNNKVETYLFVLIIIVIAASAHILLKYIVAKKFFYGNKFVKKITHQLLGPFIWLAAFYISFRSLELAGWLYDIINIIYIVAATWIVTRLAINAFRFIAESFAHKTKPGIDQKKISPILLFAKLIIWFLGVLYLLNYLGVDITAALAGLGIGGIAVALASQTILGDLFSYFVITFDKPFEIGDFLIFDDKLGVIEKIGIKSTKIRALSGEQIIVSNSNLVNSRLHNYKRMERRRVVFNFGVLYQTSAEKLKLIPAIVKAIIEENELTEFDRSHFKSYGNFSLDFENVYYIKSNDYNVYMDIQQEINLKIFEKFEQMSISFAYPTQTLFVNKS